MDNNAKIKKVLTLAEKELNESEKKFGDAVKKIQAKANTTLISVNNMSVALGIVAEVKIATDELYVSYESVVRLIDEGCRPLINENTYKSTIKLVADLIKKINEDSSGLSSDIGGSLDGLDLGDLRSERYIASLEAKAIEKFWKLKYETGIETEKEKKEIKRKREIELQIKKEEELEKKEEEERLKAIEDAKRQAIEKAYALREKNIKYIESEKEICNEKLKSFKSDVNKSLKNATEILKEKIKRKENSLNGQIEDANKELSSVGFFKFAEKKELKKKIENLYAEVGGYRSGEIFDKLHGQIEEKAQNAIDKYNKSLDKYIDNKFVKSNMTEEDFFVKKIVLDYLSTDSCFEKEESSIVDEIKKAKKIKKIHLSDQKINTILKKLVKQNVLSAKRSENAIYYISDYDYDGFTDGRATIELKIYDTEQKQKALLIYDTLKKCKQPLTLFAMAEKNKKFEKYTFVEMLEVARMCVNIDAIGRGYGKTTTYSLKCDVETLDAELLDEISKDFSENPAYANVPCPEPPAIDKLFDGLL